MVVLVALGCVLAYVLGTMQTAWAIRAKRKTDTLEVVRKAVATIQRQAIETQKRERVIGAAALLMIGSRRPLRPGELSGESASISEFFQDAVEGEFSCRS